VPVGGRVRPRLRHAVLAAVLLIPMTLTATLGTINFSEDETAIASFWPAAAFQVVFSIWFGVYGALAGVIGPMLGNALVGSSATLFVPANAIQSVLAGLWFRWRKRDPRLQTWRDWLELILVGILAANALGAGAGVSESWLRGVAEGGEPRPAGFWTMKYLGWFGGNSIPCLLLVPLMLKAASPVIIRGGLFCPRFWGGLDLPRRRRRRHRFSDVPMAGKLMLLTLVAGILPLSLVAGWAIWGLVSSAERMIAVSVGEDARMIRNEAERHALILRTWAADLDRVGTTPQRRAELLAEFAAVKEAFKDLAIRDREPIVAVLAPSVREVLRDKRVGFVPAADPDHPAGRGLMGIAVLRSQPDKLLTGLCVWRQESPMLRPTTLGQDGAGKRVALFVTDLEEGNVLYRDAPGELHDWRPPRDPPPEHCYRLEHGGQTWNAGEAVSQRLEWRFIRLASAENALIFTLGRTPVIVAVLINLVILAIFGSLIAGAAIARRIGGRVMDMAERVRESGAEPGKLHVPVRGRDELGYLADTINRVSRELAENVRRLQETTAEKERLAAEMALARQVQQTILPAAPPRVAGFEFAATCLPAREVGGDFFDFIQDADGRVVMMVGDAVGKGLRAAMYTTETHGLAHAAALEHATPERILTAVNSAIVSARGASPDFVTALCAVLEPADSRLLYASAGHHPPLHVRDGQTRSLKLGSVPLGLLADTQYTLHHVDLAPGDTVILYTDGVTEAADVERRMLGLEGLEAVARRRGDASAAELLEAVMAEVRRFVGDVPQSDDITLLVLRRCT
jgi:serine phosphatase RsbU (regulator of sigma subunit)/integral membrane sensor domain MASE1